MPDEESVVRSLSTDPNPIRCSDSDKRALGPRAPLRYFLIHSHMSVRVSVYLCVSVCPCVCVSVCLCVSLYLSMSMLP